MGRCKGFGSREDECYNVAMDNDELCPVCRAIAVSGIHDSFSGSITGEVLTFNPDAIPEPDTLHIRMTRGRRRIADELHKAFGGFRRVIIDVDGEQHEFSADSLIRLLEKYEDALEPHSNQLEPSRWHELFGTPERAARTLVDKCEDHHFCEGCPADGKDHDCTYDALLGWLRGDV